MMRTRRDFLTDVGRGMVVAGVGAGLAADLGLAPARAGDEPERLLFGDLEPLVALVQETPADRVLPALVERLRAGTPAARLVAATALANARTFGGEDYVGFHSLMALAPSYHMSREMPDDRSALPVLKVLYRNSRRLQEWGGSKKETLHPVEPATVFAGRPGDELLREAVRQRDLGRAEGIYARLASSPADALNRLLTVVEDATEVHRVVMVYRAWDLLDLVGRERAHTMLRQSVHYCVRNEGTKYIQYSGNIRTLLPQLLERHHLMDGPRGDRPADDDRVARLSETVFGSSPADAAEAVAAALADGMAPDAVGEAISLAANQLVLRDEGRTAAQASPGKPAGSVHGDGIGVHASDSANAWRNIARVAQPRHAAACLILAGYQVALDRTARGGDFLHWQAYPRGEAREKVRNSDPAALLAEADAAVRTNDQTRACAVVARYGELGHPDRPMFDLLLRHAVSQDGALHAEKYYRTVTEEFVSTRPAFRWRHLVGLARVTASEYGQPAPGYAEACGLLKVSSSV